MVGIHGNYRSIVAALVVLLAPALCPAAGKDILPGLPPDTHLVLFADNISDACVQFTRTDIGREFTGKAFAPLVKELIKRDQAGPLHLKPWFGVDWPELVETRCPAALAVFPVKPNEPGAALVFEADQSQNSDLFDSVNKYFTGKGWKVWKKKAGDASLTVFESARPPATRVYIEVDAFSGIANSLAAAEKLAAVKADKSLVKEKDVEGWLATDAGVVHLPGDVRYFSRPLPLWKASHEPLPGKKGLRDSLNRAERLGLGGVTSMSGRIVWDLKEPNGWLVKCDLRIQEPHQGALQALALSPGKPIAAPAWLDAKTISVTSGRWDFKTGLKAIAAIFDEMEDPGPNGIGLFDQIIDGLIEDPEGPRVDLRKDFFHLLGPQVISIRDEVVVGGKPRQHRMFVAQCDHEVKVLDTLTKFFKGDPDVVATKVGKFHMWAAKPGLALFVKGEGKEKDGDIRAAAIGDSQVFFATDPALLKASLDAIVKGKPAKTLEKSAEWQTYEAWRTKHRGESAVLESWSRPSRALAAGYEKATQPLKGKEEDGLTQKMWLFLLFGKTDRSADLPLKIAPKFDAWSASLSPTGLILSETKGGNTLTLGAPQPPAMP